jgi:hypothetical protein
MEMQEWKENIIAKALRQISYQSNMSNTDIDKITLVLSDYLDDGITILRNWRKLKNDNEFLIGLHNSSLVLYIKSKYQANGRDLFSEYSSGGIKANTKKTPESVLKSTCKQVI